VRLVAVLDVRGGVVVRGVAGRRTEYRPIVSALTPSTAPLDVARAFAGLGLRELYVADLDAIAGAEPAWELFDALRAEGFRLWVDAGVRGPERADRLAAAQVESVVVGLETADGPALVADLARRHGERLLLSLDLREGRPLTAGAWGGADAWSIAAEAVRLGIRRLLVLDLARVGVGTGVGTEELCARMVREYPEVEVSAGGGVRDRNDLLRLRTAGVQAVLVASALHDGQLGSLRE
jgi:phosphoribosylformimino-5-aminoimidazole carboxamide ribotide isomerase